MQVNQYPVMEHVPVDYHAAFLALAVAVTEAYTLATVADDPVRVEDKLAQAFNIVQVTVLNVVAVFVGLLIVLYVVSLKQQRK
jgi:hypothetical protein